MELIKNIISRGYDYLYNFERNYLKMQTSKELRLDLQAR